MLKDGRGTAGLARGNTVWVPEDVVRDCVLSADGHYPLESGGVLMGWWSVENIAVVTAMIGPGPEALHERYAFQPDQDWQIEQIALHYERSERRETYLGDWHTHPDARNGTLSWTDRSVVRRIIATPAARCPVPLMMILWGAPESWNLSMWQGWLRPRKLLWDKLAIDTLRTATYQR
ncbi:Mov34/MPN/PAD-1 family protein [Nitratireductor luteus]|uniref:Mov34/MPN/PAD-1 family protein n=1 Tax=Nitratireductor luteus TaxID=2976980 RepID=UPI0022406451|nr:Mov34/MPN/PAD-1 family protein [Nitratireductor luteus]